MKLTELIKSIEHFTVKEDSITDLSSSPDVQSIHYDSRQVGKGGLFVAVKGLVSDGHTFIPAAVKNGAVAVVSENGKQHNGTVAIRVTDSRKALAAITSEFYGNPSDNMFLIGITGTNGKTTITYLLENIFINAGYTPGIIGTVNYRYNGKVYPNPMTTPESSDLQRILYDMKQGGVTHVVMEVSSHAIDLDRVYRCSFDTAVFTNLTQDHLDYHKTMDDYWVCKKRLFTELLPSSAKSDNICAVVNCNDTHGKKLQEELGYKLITTGDQQTDIQAQDAKISIDGIRAVIETPDGSINTRTTAIGRHNLENILNAVGAAISAGIGLESIKAGIETFNVPGRLEKIDNSKGIGVFVDYAHTPDAIKNVLKEVKTLTPGKLICVFGCGGDRDNSKRSIMGSIAEKYSDVVIITSDNPRSEDPNRIIKDILEGIETPLFVGTPGDLSKGVSTRYHHVEADREKAIKFAVQAAQKGDTVVIAGKGHETYQITNTVTIDFDDRDVARRALNDEN